MRDAYEIWNVDEVANESHVTKQITTCRQTFNLSCWRRFFLFEREEDKEEEMNQIVI